jgi:adenylosuccinate synthase
MATIVVDLGFGDAGKGSIVDYLSRLNPSTYKTIVRFNGGCQAAHNVVTPSGQHHVFSQFGSGSFLKNVHTHLSRFMLLDPLAMRNEANAFKELTGQDLYSRLTVDREALVVTPLHKAVNRLREEQRGENRHGSCGVGIGETMSDSLKGLEVRAKHLKDNSLERRLEDIWLSKKEEFGADFPFTRMNIEDMADALRHYGRYFSLVDQAHLEKLSQSSELIFEGAQGVLIDEWYGFHPYTTWSTCTFKNALTLLEEINYQGDITKMGVSRAYMVRHGAGPLPTESKRLESLLAEEHNGIDPWQGRFRMGWFDLPLIRYALKVCKGIDYLALTHLDKVKYLTTVCHAYPFELGLKKNLTDLEYQKILTERLFTGGWCKVPSPNNKDDYIQFIEEGLGVSVGLISQGPTAASKEQR